MAKKARATPPLKVLAKPKTLRSVAMRLARLHAKLLLAAAVMLAVFLALRGYLNMPTRLVTAWDTGIGCYLVVTMGVLMRCDIDHIRRRAAEEDEGAYVVLLLTIAATLASLVSIVFLLGGSTDTGNGEAAVRALLAMATIVLSWFFIHTIFSLHYAHEYYGERRDGKIGGLNFPGDDEPDYWDFFYFSLVIGMTSQVSDVAVTSKVLRHVVSMHGVLSFFFNLTVLALTVNMLSNLVGA